MSNTIREDFLPHPKHSIGDVIWVYDGRLSPSVNLDDFIVKAKVTHISYKAFIDQDGVTHDVIYNLQCDEKDLGFSRNESLCHDSSKIFALQCALIDTQNHIKELNRTFACSKQVADIYFSAEEILKAEIKNYLFGSEIAQRIQI